MFVGAVGLLVVLAVVTRGDLVESEICESAYSVVRKPLNLELVDLRVMWIKAVRNGSLMPKSLIPSATKSSLGMCLGRLVLGSSE